jgi:hypothetical protein
MPNSDAANAAPRQERKPFIAIQAVQIRNGTRSNQARKQSRPTPHPTQAAGRTSDNQQTVFIKLVQEQSRNQSRF